MNTIITESTEHGDIFIDIYQKLANDRILFISDYLDDRVATDICATLLLKDSEDSDKKITIFINSEGGDIRNAFMIYDVMKIIKAPIETVCLGSTFDETAIILVGGSPGHRFATKNSVIAIGQLTYDWVRRSNLTDAEKVLAQATRDNKRMMEIIAKHSNKSLKEINSYFDKRVFMNPLQSLKYGLIDKIIQPSK